MIVNNWELFSMDMQDPADPGAGGANEGEYPQCNGSLNGEWPRPQ